MRAMFRGVLVDVVCERFFGVDEGEYGVACVVVEKFDVRGGGC